MKRLLAYLFLVLGLGFSVNNSVAEIINVGDLPSANIFDTNNYKHRIFIELEKKTYNVYTSKNEKNEQFFLWFNEYEDGKLEKYTYEFIISMNNPVNSFAQSLYISRSLSVGEK